MAQPAPAAAAAPAAGAAPRAAAAPALPRPVVLPDEFAGTSGDDWVTYLARFNASCVVNGYTPAQQLQFLPCRLKDAAFQVFTAVIGRIPQITYAQMCAELTAAFNPPQQGPIVEAEFRSRVKKPGETQIEFASALQSLAARAFPGQQQTPLYERLLLNQFVDGQTSSDLRLHIRSASPPDLDTAVRRALEMAAVFNAEARRAPAPAPIPTVCAVTSPSAAALAAHVDPPRSRVLDQDVFLLLKQISTQLEGLSVAHHRHGPPPPPSAAPGRDGPGRQFSRPPPRCYSCNEPGHFRADCPRRNSRQPPRYFGRRSGN